MRPKPSMTMITSQMQPTVRFAQRSVEMVTAKMIRMPPIVGVPFFAWCEPGPSSRIVWPIWSSCSFRISQGPTTKQITRAVIAA